VGHAVGAEHREIVHITLPRGPVFIGRAGREKGSWRPPEKNGIAKGVIGAEEFAKKFQ
jgi:hypothetical protein